ncbi:MAG: DMT family transporter [Hyphomicrobiaceae bacterium]|nr:MAG: DMT family transporter [Hyphomicrobiaceae bacterium]
MTGPQSDPSALKGAAWMLVCLLFLSLMAIMVRQVSPFLTTMEVMAWRGLLSFVMVLSAMGILGRVWPQIRTTRIRLHFLRNTIHFAGQYAWIYAISVIPLALAFALEFTMPVWIALLAPLLANERLTQGRVVAAIFGFFGTLIALRPDGSGLSSGALVMLGAALAFALSVIAVKRLTATDSAMSIVFYMALIQTPMAFVLLGGVPTVPDLKTFRFLAILSASGLVAQYAMARAYAHADAMVVMPIDYLRLPLIALVGTAFFSEALDPYVLLGGAVIIAGNWWNLKAERADRGARGSG